MTGTADDPAMLQVEGVSKAFGSHAVLKEVSFALRAGEALALVGENGAGKSTLMAILAGTLAADAGAIRFLGRPFRPAGPRGVAALGIAVAFQETALAPDLTVAENLLFAREPRRLGLIRPGALHRQADALLAGLGFTLDVRRLGRSLSAAERHIAEIARAVGRQPRLLILDEPTAALSAHDARAVLAAVERVTARGGAVIFISHRLDEVIEAADRAIVLKDGAVTLDAPRGRFDRDALVRAMVGRALTDIFPPRPGRLAAPAPRLRVTDATAPGLARLSFAVRPGEIVGFSGLEGQGQRPLAGALCGMAPFRSGAVALDGVPVVVRSAAAAIGAGIAAIPEDRKTQGLALDLPVRVNVSLFALSRATRWGWLPARLDRDYAEAARRRFGMRIAGLEQPVRQLSGGNQQKVVFARWMADTPKVLVLHEPTKGIDVATKAEIYRLIGELTGRGVAVVLISSDMLELIGLCDRIHVLHGGAIAGSLERAAFAEEALMRLAAGPDGPAGALLRPACAETGPDRADEGAASTRRPGSLSMRFAGSLRSHLALGLPALVLTVLVATLAASLSGSFASGGNFGNLANRLLPLGLATLGETVVLLAGRIDLSVGAVMSLSTALMALWSDDLGWAAVPLTLGTGMLCGLFSALGVIAFRIDALIMTLATGAVVKGITLLLLPSPGGAVDERFYEALFGQDRPFGLPLVIIVAAFGVAVLLLSWTRSGRSLYAFGSDPRAARANGVSGARVDLAGFAVAGILSSAAGIALSIRILSGDPLIGDPYTLDAVTAAILGGIALSGGRGSPLGALMGAAALVLIDNAFNLMGLETSLQAIVKGLVFVAALLVFVRARGGAALA